jgi:hypothetical protein
MNLLDENVNAMACDLLSRWRIRWRKVGEGVGRKGASDEDVIPVLHRLRSVTFFTRDVDYYQRHLCHLRYCLVYLDVADEFTAATIRRFLRHSEFRTWAQRKGKVIRVIPTGMQVWRVRSEELEFVPWSS